MSISSRINGTSAVTGPGNKLFYRSSSYGSYTQIKHCYYRASASGSWTEVYYYDATPSNIVFTSASGNVLSSSYTLTATITDTESGIASVAINGQNYPVTEGSTVVYVSQSYTLGNGANTFTINVVDVAGNSSSASLTVNYVNQKDNPYYNWSDTTGPDPYWVWAKDDWYIYRAYAKGTSDSFAQARATINSRIPFPKGVHSVSGRIDKSTECGVDRSIGYECTITLFDNTAGAAIGTTSFKGSEHHNHEGQGSSTGTGHADFAWWLTADQSVHDLVMIIDGYAESDQHTVAQARVGLTSSLVSFTWY